MVSVKIDLDKNIIPPFIIPTASRDFDLSHFFGLRFDFDLPEEDFDRFRIVVGNELCVAQLVDERLATACEIVGVEEPHGMARNDESNAIFARSFSFASVDQCLPRSRLRLGVR